MPSCCTIPRLDNHDCAACNSIGKQATVTYLQLSLKLCQTAMGSPAWSVPWLPF